MDDPLGVSQPDEIWLGSEWEEGEIEEDPVGDEEEPMGYCYLGDASAGYSMQTQTDCDAMGGTWYEQMLPDESEYSDDALGSCAIPGIPAIGQSPGVIENLTELECMSAGDGTVWTVYEDDEPEEEEEELPPLEGDNYFYLPHHSQGEFRYQTFNLAAMQEAGLLAAPYEIITEGGVDGEVCWLVNEDASNNFPLHGLWKLFGASRFLMQDGEDWVQVGGSSGTDMNDFYSIFPYDVSSTTATSYYYLLLRITLVKNAGLNGVFRFDLRNSAAYGEPVQLEWDIQSLESAVGQLETDLIATHPYDDPLNPFDRYYIAPHDITIAQPAMSSARPTTSSISNLVLLNNNSSDQTDSMILINKLLDND